MRAIADVFTTSPVMSAMRFVELSSKQCAAMYSEAGLVKWAKRSRTFTTFIAPGSRIPRESVAGDYFDGGANCDIAQSRPAETWLGFSELAATGAEIVEHATVIPEPGWGPIASVGPTSHVRKLTSRAAHAVHELLPRA